MIVRRIKRSTGREVKPVTIKQAAWAIARAIITNPHRCDVEPFEMALESGEPNKTRTYEYIPDADPES